MKAPALLGLMMLLGCEAGETTPAATATTTAPAPKPSREPEAPVGAAEAAALSKEFGLPGCSGITRLRTVTDSGLVAESWRVRDGDRCFAAWAERQRRYALLSHLDVPQSERDRLPWLCAESGAHVAQCETRGAEPTLLIEQPRYAEFLLLRRIRKIAS